MNDARDLVAPRNHRVGRGVIGILGRGHEYLMIRRAEGVAKPGCWCFPGGHVERGETPRQAVGRELFEELGIHVRPTKRLGSLRVMDSRHILVAWRVEHVGGDFCIAQKEIAEIRWVPIDHIRAIRPGLPSNESVLELLARAIGAIPGMSAGGNRTGAPQSTEPANDRSFRRSASNPERNRRVGAPGAPTSPW